MPQMERKQEGHAWRLALPHDQLCLLQTSTHNTTKYIEPQQANCVSFIPRTEDLVATKTPQYWINSGQPITLTGSRIIPNTVTLILQRDGHHCQQHTWLLRDCCRRCGSISRGPWRRNCILKRRHHLQRKPNKKKTLRLTSTCKRRDQG